MQSGRDFYFTPVSQSFEKDTRPAPPREKTCISVSSIFKYCSYRALYRLLPTQTGFVTYTGDLQSGPGPSTSTSFARASIN